MSRPRAARAVDAELSGFTLDSIAFAVDGPAGFILEDIRFPLVAGMVIPEVPPAELWGCPVPETVLGGCSGAAAELEGCLR